LTVARPVFDQTEGYALSVLDALAAGSRVHPSPGEKRLDPSEELIRIGAQRLSIHLHRLLLRSGGQRERTVLREGRRASGRMWDAALNEPFRLRFSEASPRLWLGLVQLGLRPPRAEELEEKLGRVTKVEGTECGDWLFYAQAFSHTARLGIAFHPEGWFARRLRSASPVTVLVQLEPHLMQRAAVRTHLLRLLQKGTVRIPECIDDLLLSSWRDIVARAAERSPTIESFTLRFNAAAEVLDAWIDALDEKQRLDLAGPVMRLLAAFAAEIVTAPVEELREEIIRRHSPRSVHQRQEAHRAMGRLLAIGVRLAELRARFARLGYGDERWEEGQLVLASYDELLSPHIDRIRTLERGLRGIIG
jgi:hypothetical protein